MKYALLIHVDEDALEALSEQERRAFDDAHRALQQETSSSGELVLGQELAGRMSATVVRTVGSKMLVSDGPYAETREYFGGYYVMDVDNQERAVQLAQRLPEAGIEGCSVEVRPVMQPGGAEL